MTTTLASTSLNQVRVVLREETLGDGTKVTVAEDLDRDGCIAQGSDDLEALASLEEARREYDAVLDLQREHASPEHSSDLGVGRTRSGMLASIRISDVQVLTFA